MTKQPLAKTIFASAMSAAVCAGIAIAPVQAAPAAEKTTVLALDPAFFGLSKDWLHGDYNKDPYVWQKVDYVNIPGLRNVAKGASNLDAALHDTPGKKVVLGHSEGAEVADFWLRQYGPTSDINALDVKFVLTGDPENASNGCMTVPKARQVDDPEDPDAKQACTFVYPSDPGPDPDHPKFTGPGLPANTPYDVTVVTRQYDYYADCPDNLISNSPDAHPAFQNRQASRNNGGKGDALGVHLDYKNVNLASDPTSSTKEGNVTYVLVRTYYLPLVSRKVYFGTAAQKDAKRAADDVVLRPLVEADYTTRKVTAPGPALP